MSKENACPWCGAEQDCLWDYELRNDGDHTEAECASCDKKIKITMHISVDFEIEAIGCDPHKFDIGEYWYPGADYLNLKCTKCKTEFYDHALEGGKYEKLKKSQYGFVGRGLEEATKRGLV